MQPIYTRRIQLEGAVNTRDLGGFPIPGGITRWGSFLRSDGPSRLSEADIATLCAYGVTDSVDLRSTQERADKPSLLAAAEGVNDHHVPMLDNIMSGGDVPFPDTLGDLYVSMLDHGADDFAKVFRIFAAAKGCVLFHCAVGKDRTGMTAMLLLDLAGAYVTDILADYAASEIYLHDYLAPDRAAMEARGLDTGLLGSNVANMRRGLAYMKEKYGNAAGFLATGGLGAGEIETVQKKMQDKA